MDQSPFDINKFTDIILKESKNIKLQLDEGLEIDDSLLEPLPCPDFEIRTETTAATDASIEQLSMWSQQLQQLEHSLGINKVPAKVRGLDTTKSRTLLHRSVSIPQLNQTRLKLQETVKISEIPEKLDIDLIKKQLSEHCKKYSARDRSSGPVEIDKDLINDVCNDLNQLTHLFADVSIEYEKQPVIEANPENKELSIWLADINQVKPFLKVY